MTRRIRRACEHYYLTGRRGVKRCAWNGKTCSVRDNKIGRWITNDRKWICLSREGENIQVGRETRESWHSDNTKLEYLLCSYVLVKSDGWCRLGDPPPFFPLHWGISGSLYHLQRENRREGTRRWRIPPSKHIWGREAGGRLGLSRYLVRIRMLDHLFVIRRFLNIRYLPFFFASL